MKLIKARSAVLPFVQVIILLLIFLSVTSCRSRHNKDAQVFRYNETTGIATLDPAFAKNQSVIWPIHQLYNTLVETDGQLNMVPSLATRWDVSPDRKTYLFHLRQDVFFHDSPAFTNGKG